ncbi:MAG TPA: MBL fold metallo-hydrolase [Opitutaceae bacterium]|nr:MBL fold metallo-hydrolase [Opitutaceae bacterium]
MNRRDFLARSTVLAAAGGLLRLKMFAQNPSPAPAPTPAARAPATVNTEFRPLRRNVGLFLGRGGTIGWLASKASLVVVDTQFPDTAALCLAGLPERGTRLVDVVVNTHHHADHTSGNPVFKPVSQTIVAQRHVPKLQLRAAEQKDTTWQQVFADTLFDEVWRQDGGDEIVTARHFGPAHTGGDAIITFERANVVHMGDLVFNRICPAIDRPGGANIRNWIQTLEQVTREFPADAIYVYGHGNAKFGVSGTRDDLLVMRDFLAALLAHTEKEIAAGKTRAEIRQLASLPGFPDFDPAPGQASRLPACLEAAYDELTVKKSIRAM